MTTAGHHLYWHSGVTQADGTAIKRIIVTQFYIVDLRLIVLNMNVAVCMNECLPRGPDRGRVSAVSRLSAT